MGRFDSGATYKKKLLLLGCGTVIALITAELLVRLLFPHVRGTHQHTSSIWRDDFLSHDRLGRHHPLLGWTLRPNEETVNRGWEFEHVIRTNSRGFRDEEVPYERRPDIRRIVLLGDSFGMGDGVDRQQSFAELLEDFLPKTEVVNLSVSGYGTDQELLAYETEGKKYRPDIVLLAFTSANDFQNNVSKQEYGLGKPHYEFADGKVILRGVPVPEWPAGKISDTTDTKTSSPFPTHDFFDANSALYALAFDRISRVPSIKKRWEKTELLYPQVEAFYAGQVGIFNTRPSPQLASAWELTLGLLEKWQKEALDESAQPVLLLIPSHLQVYPEIWNCAVRQYDLRPEDFNPRYPNNRLKDFCKARNLAVIDLLPDFRTAAEAGKSLYYKRNPHWNREGHYLAAKVIARELSGIDRLDKKNSL